MYKLAQPTGGFLNLDAVVIWIGVVVNVFDSTRWF